MSGLLDFWRRYRRMRRGGQPEKHPVLAADEPLALREVEILAAEHKGGIVGKAAGDASFWLYNDQLFPIFRSAAVGLAGRLADGALD